MNNGNIERMVAQSGRRESGKRWIEVPLGLVGMALWAGCAPCGLKAADGPRQTAQTGHGPALPVGAPITAAMDRPLDSRRARVGDAFTAVVTRPVVGTDGRTHVVPGALLRGHVERVASDRIDVAFDALETKGGFVALPATVLGADADDTADAPRFVRLGRGSEIRLVVEHEVVVPSATVSAR